MPRSVRGLAATVLALLFAPSTPPLLAQIDLGRLPVASGQAAQVTAWEALGVRSMVPGRSYLDPTTGVRVWKATGASMPTGNTGAGHDYADGGWQVSRPWGPALSTYTILVRTLAEGYWLVDFERGAGFRRWRQFPQHARPWTDLAFTFSALPGTAQVAFIFTGTQIIRFNTTSMTVANVPPWPWSVRGGTWLHQDRDDRWFVMLEDEHTALAFNAVTGKVLRQSWSSLNEPRLERDGRYVALGSGGAPGFRIWDLDSNTLGNPITGFPFAHNASARGHWIATNWDLSSPFAINRVGVDGQATRILAPSFGPAVHHSGSWVQDDAELKGDLRRQWTIASTSSTTWAGSRLLNAIGYVRSDGSDSRLLCHTYHVGDDYWSQPVATTSPDGRIVIFTSNMMLLGGRPDLFVAEVPVATQ